MTDKYTAEHIVWLRPWAPNLFSFRLSRPAGFRFTPGQFARLGVKVHGPSAAKNPSGERIVWRAYTVASAADAPYLEFFSIVIADGEFTLPLARLGIGDTVYVDRTSYGFLTLDRFENGQDLWLLCTGTGLAPFLSMLWEPATWRSYENLIVAHSVRYPNELAYADTLRDFAANSSHASHAGKLHYQPIVTRAPMDGALLARIPALLSSGELERRVGVQLDQQRSRLMMCGNPAMVDEARKILTAAGFAMSRRGRPAHMAVENYW